MKKLFLSFLSVIALSGCALYDESQAYQLSVSFLEPTEWNGKIIPPHQSCHTDGGIGSTPPLYVSYIPEGTNLLILEIDDMDKPALSVDGGHGSIGFYHSGDFSAVLLPVPGETNVLPNYAFKEKGNRYDKVKPFPYMPPCIQKGHRFVATVKAVKRTGSFDKQKTILLGEGKIDLGVY